MDAADVTEVFAKDEVSRIYLNFSDPWPKDRHAKRRLTSRQFFARYDAILKPDGRLEFKTDNQDLFTFSLEEIPEAGWHLDASTRDLHHDSVSVSYTHLDVYKRQDPATAAYSKNCIPTIGKSLILRQFTFDALREKCKTVCVTEKALAACTDIPVDRQFFNLDTRQDYYQALKIYLLL